MIRKLTPSVLSSNSLIVAAVRFEEELAKLPAADSFTGDLRALLKTDTGQLKGSLAKLQANKYTRLLKTKDRLRDEDFLSLKNLLITYHTSRVPRKREAALRLSEAIKSVNYRLHNQGYVDQTADLEKLFSLLDTGESQADLAELGAGELYTQLKTSQEEFEAVYNQKAGEDEAKKEVPRLREARGALEDSLEGVISYLNLRERMNAAGYAATNDLFDQILQDIQTAEKARRSREEGEEEAGDP